MNTRRALAALLALASLSAALSIAATPEPTAIVALTADSATTGNICRPSAGDRVDLAQGMPLDCCKGHKGICGCRAGKLVCCDGTVSKDPNCACYSDWGVEN